MPNNLDEKRLLIVDDEPAIVRMLDGYFRIQGYATVCAGSAREALAAVNEAIEHGRCIDLALLDVNMPGMDGFELCRRLREALTCPIIFLTARIEDTDQLDGFAAGADDYVLKPFSLEVLGGRVRAHLAREERRGSEERERSMRVFSNITVDFAERTVTVAAADCAAADASAAGGSSAAGGGSTMANASAAGGSTAAGASPKPEASATLDLTRTEFDIIALLSKNPGRVYDRSLIYEQVWGWDATGDPAIVREHVRRIRNKFVEAGATGDVIETVWGVGYRWVAR